MDIVSRRRSLSRMVGRHVGVAPRYLDMFIVSEHLQLSWNRLRAAKNMAKKPSSRPPHVDPKWFCLTMLVQIRVANVLKVEDTENAAT